MSQSQQSGPIRPQRVSPTSIGELATAIGGRVFGSADVSITGVSLRAQSISPGDLFAALPGSRVHGARFAADAVRAGAAAIFTDPAGRELIETELSDAGLSVIVHPDPRSVLGELSSLIYGDPSQSLTLIGITGTSGKTTTAFMVESILLADGRSVGLLGTVQTRINGVAQPSSLTTPEAPDLQALFAAMVEQGVDTVVMEVSSHALSLGRVAGSHFDVGAFTNLSQDHLDFHPTMDDYFDAKAILFKEDSTLRADRSVVCVDDEWGRAMARIAPSPVTVSTGQVPAQWTAGESSIAVDGTQRVRVSGPDVAELDLALPLPGRFNVANALVALAITRSVGVEFAPISAGLAAVSVPGRLQRISEGQEFLAVVDYAHKPAAVEAVIATLREQTDGRIGVVIGAGGDRDTGKRAQMGAAAARGAEFVVITDDNPRTEEPAAIRAEVFAGAVGIDANDRPSSSEPIRDVGDRAAAIAAAVEWASPGDVVLIAGKGHEAGQEINGVKHPFDDRVVLAAALRAKVAGVSAPAATVSDASALIRRLVEQAADAGVGSAHRDRGARTWLILGELAPDSANGEHGADEQQTVVDHDRLGRLAVRLAVDKILAVGASRAVRALHQGAVMEGSWGAEAVLAQTVFAARELLRSDPDWQPVAGDMVAIAGPASVRELTEELSVAGLVVLTA
ncbi:UDP-N-acetylmuramoyl-L-alanyl-D-glutamate--2,6-diaminopimelate ligase [Gordonia effusa NBRC 100432]|uniref:UDP-N-acetylmuramoyl-L-alanyl-D-glutamate--2,6-diaminopimelate ligase n=1 Tax=Gordonia effusa NBRC 100432 TaxID=1077974 RepID=H0R2N7_9ACTN|nr:UDP-N-acetylmuramoyl-L-alanyl-D-glutamate--2,6-diaminopimelate ligase [Gordonia effusa]GAB19338.1 UDP-N-acetylmuramoyl-L-alanyl-D-glutamate--2,6-diaminopimelate ligase [Gordonia effusa NBRC 100432]